MTVVLLGGSITCGNGMKYGRGYKKDLAEWLNAAFPLVSGSHIVFNGCQQATTSAVYAVCLREFLPQVMCHRGMVLAVHGAGSAARTFCSSNSKSLRPRTASHGSRYLSPECPHHMLAGGRPGGAGVCY